jgi:IclR family KDG regulon transcriptional repressor
MSHTPQGNHAPKLIASVQRAVDILDLFDHTRIELGTTDIARELSLAKSTISGLVQTLEWNGLLERNPTTRKYRLGYKLAEYAGILLNQTDLRQLAKPYLEELLDWCNESVNLAVPDKSHMVYIERLYGTNSLGMRSQIGKREPVHSTALGKAVLAYTSPAKIQELLPEIDFIPRTSKTITDPQALLEALALTRRQEYALDDEENELGGRCVAASVLDHRREPVAAISISAPIQRLPMEKVPEYGEKVIVAARAVSKRLGYLDSTAR